LHAKYGLAIDNVIGADVVTADGQLLTASAAENPDLFWGIRGGSGNFGIVTSLEYRLHEVGPVLGGAVFYPAAKAKDVMHFWREFAAGSPDELVTQGGSFNLPDGVPVFAIAACYSGSVSEGEGVEALADLWSSPRRLLALSLIYNCKACLTPSSRRGASHM
jgi:hypothetical protein